MSVASELLQAGFKGLSKTAINFIEKSVPKTDHAGIIQAVVRHPNELIDYGKHIDNFVKKKDQSGILPMIQMSDKWNNEVVDASLQADTLTHGTNRGTKQNNLYKSIEPDQSIESTLFGGPDAKPITSDQMAEFGRQIESKEIEAPKGLTNRNEEISDLARRGLLEREPKTRFESIFFGSKEFTDEKDIPRMIRRFRSSTLDDIGLGRTERAANRRRDRGRPGVRIGREGKLTLGEDQGFYAGTPKGSHAHHWTPLAVLDKVVEGLSPKQVKTFLKYMETDLGIFGGNHIGNLRQLPSNVHNMLHRRLDAMGYNSQTLQSFAKSTLAQRKAFMKKMKADFDVLEKDIFREMMINKGNQPGPKLK
jgi:hypothetical protein